MNNHLLRYSWTVLLPLSLLLATSGCGSLRPNKGGNIGEIHLFGLPVALTPAGSPQPAGVGVRIYASAPGGTQGLPIQQGRLDVLMFDQSVEGLDPRKTQLLKTWSFSAADLAPFRSVTMVGVCYSLELSWDQARPKAAAVTIVARYGGPKQAEVYSPPAVIAVGVR